MATTPTTPASPAATDVTLDPDRLIRRSSIAVVVAVAIGAGVVSYGHAYELVHTHGESGLAALIGPATVDGLMYASGMVLLQAARYRQRAPRLAHFGLWLGILATIGANVAHGLGHGWVGALVSAWPAVALIVSYELLMRLIRTGAARGAELVEDTTAPTWTSARMGWRPRRMKRSASRSCTRETAKAHRCRSATLPPPSA